MSPGAHELPGKTVCVGRFLIDIPESAEISLGSARVGGWDVSIPIDETEKQFTERLLAREKKLQSSRNRQQLPTLEAAKDIRAKEVFGKVFMFDRVRSYHVEYGKRVDIEAVSFQSLVHSNGKTFELSADLRSEEKLSGKMRVASQFERWSFGQLPGKPGFCIGEAFVNEPLSIDDREFVMMFIGMKEYPDLTIAISTWAGIDLEAPLLERDRNNAIKTKYADRFKDLGTGERVINGINGGQLSDEVLDLNGTTAFSFQWESKLEKTNLKRPRILLELNTGTGRPGNPVNSSLSKSEAIALWNQISSSIRDRQEGSTGQAKTLSSAELREAK